MAVVCSSVAASPTVIPGWSSSSGGIISDVLRDPENPFNVLVHILNDHPLIKKANNYHLDVDGIRQAGNVKTFKWFF